MHITVHNGIQIILVRFELADHNLPYVLSMIHLRRSFDCVDFTVLMLQDGRNCIVLTFILTYQSLAESYHC